jgi:hypothetical protein
MFLAWLISPLIPVLQFLLRGVMEGILVFLRVIQQIGVQINTLRAQQDIQSFLDSPEFVAFSRGTSIVLILILFAVLAIWAMRRSGVFSRRRPDETRESIATRDLLLNQLKSFLGRWRARSVVPAPRYLPLSGDDARRAVRQAYQDFLEWARVRVAARAPHQTPAMYARHIGSLPGVPSEPVDTLTTLYLRARYAADEMTSDEAQAAHSALVRLQATPVIQSPLTEE